MIIGRKIYYELVTGNIIQETSERQGSVIETTQEQDFQTYISLSERVPSSVGVIQLTYGQYADKFGVYHYHIDPVTSLIVWGALIDVNAPIPQPTSQELKENQMTIMNGLTDIYMAQLGL